MKHKLWSGLTAILLIPALGTTSSSHAEQPQTPDVQVNQQAGQGMAAAAPTQSPQNSGSAIPVADQSQASSLSPTPATPESPTVEVLKVGEYQFQARANLNQEVIAKILSHELGGRTAATLYVRNIPVLTFLEASPRDQNSAALSTSQVPSQSEYSATHGVNAQVKVADREAASALTSGLPNNLNRPLSASEAPASNPVWRATAVAARLNQLSRDNIDPNTITVKWDGNRRRYIIQANGEELIEINDITMLPDSTKDEATDALQATNRLRRQLGNAAPLSDIEGRPRPRPQAATATVAVGPVYLRIQGWASWYGPGFDGNLSASGEPFNQNDLTAAHRELPFGTKVRVTNLDNGQSVVVRINDRGPFIPGRIIDLSAGAARLLGMMQSGVAPVQLEVVAPQP